MSIKRFKVAHNTLTMFFKSAENYLMIKDRMMNKMYVKQAKNYDFLARKYEEKPKADSNSRSAVHKPNTFNTEQ